MNTANAYTELGLKPGASEREVKAAWRRLVSHWHPDRNGSAGAGLRMQRINQALEAIREAGFGRGDDLARSAGTPHAADDRSPSDDLDGDSERAQADARDDEGPGRTLQRKVKLTLEEAAAGCTKALRGRYSDTCPSCAGVGHRVLDGGCEACAGSGVVRQAGWYGLFSTAVECPACRGTGIGREACAPCGGQGKLGTHGYRLSVRIPHGVRDGDLLHVDARRARAGGALRGIELRVEVAAHPLFELDDDGTLRCTVPVDGFAWIANRSVEVPTLGGLRSLRLNRDLRCHRLKGEGFPVQRRGLRGDLLVTVVPTFAERFSADQEILLDQLLATSSDPRLAAWQRKLQAWQRGSKRRSD